MSLDKTIVIFGAGKIGRSFIGQLFSRGGYRVIFIDVFKPVIEELNRRGEYEVVIKGDRGETISVTNVSGILAEDHEQVADAVARTDIVATCVGKNGLASVFPLIANSLEKRAVSPKKDVPIDIIIAENIRDAKEMYTRELKKRLDPDYPFESLVGLVETSIGKMVPIMKKEDIEQDMLRVFAESYNTLILDKLGFKNNIPDVPGLDPKKNMKAWVDRKSFIHNLGHAVTAYTGYIHDPEMKYIYEVLEVQSIYVFVKEAMTQSAQALLKEYRKEFTSHELDEHIDDLLNRFRNRALGDTVYRVGCDVQRKLGSEDRLAGAIRLGMKHNVSMDNILYGLVCGFFFRGSDEDQKMLPRDREFERDYFPKGPSFIMHEISGFVPGQDDGIINKGEAFFNQIKKREFPW